MMKSPIKYGGVAGSTPLVLSTSASAATAIPNSASGERPKYVALMQAGGASGIETADIAFGTSAAMAKNVLGEDLPIPPLELVIVDVSGFTHFRAIASAAAVNLWVCPLDNF